MLLPMIMVAGLGATFGFATTLVAFEITDQINKRVPEGERVDLFRYGTGIRKKHRALYPESKLVLMMDTFTALGIALFLVMSWLVIHSR